MQLFQQLKPAKPPSPCFASKLFRARHATPALLLPHANRA
jgi:hypothetical protein